MDHLTSTSFLLTKMVKFKRRYCKVLGKKDRASLEEWIEKVQELELTPEKNGHFVTCPWSQGDNAIDGPETCICCSLARIERLFSEMVGSYFGFSCALP